MAALVSLLLLPIPALVVGLVTLSGAGLSASLQALNVAAAAVGIVAVLGATALRDRIPADSNWKEYTIGAGVLLLLMTLFMPDAEGVRRWVTLGSVQVHVGSLVLPSLLVLVGRASERWALIVAFGVSCVLLLQPDAAQAAAFAFGWMVIMQRGPRRVPRGAVLAVLAIAGLTLLRADPLNPVPHVEGIVGMAGTEGGVWLGVSIVSLALLPLPFIAISPDQSGLALATYVTFVLIAAWLGHHPVPIMGFGVGPIVGYFLGGAALLMTLETGQGTKTYVT